MKKVSEIYKILNEISPFDLQAKWDNSGLNVGSLDSKFRQIYVSLELDIALLDSIKKDSLLILHHPLIFKPLQNFNTQTYPCNLIAKCVEKNISVISMHTNFDITHLNAAFAKRLKLENLNFKYEKMQDFSIIYSAQNKKTTLDTLLKHIKKILNLKILKYSQAKNALINNEILPIESIQNLYITCGSNAIAYNIAKPCDCVITGDIKYHDAMIASSLGISFIEIPHFESECIFSTLLTQNLQKYNIQAIISNSQNPFCHI